MSRTPRSEADRPSGPRRAASARPAGRTALAVRALAALLLLPLLAGCGERALGPADDPAPRDPSRDTPPQWFIGGTSVDPDPYDDPVIPGQLVAEIAPGWTAEDINAEWGTYTIQEIPDTPFALLGYYGYDYRALANELVARGACITCDRNYRVSSPEANQGSIAFYEGNLIHSDFVDQEALDRVHTEQAHGWATGAGITVAVVDTGVDSAHPDFAGRLVTGFDFVDDDYEPLDIQDGIDQDQDGMADEAAGHGTHVAGLVAAVAPGAAIMPVRVLDTEGHGNVFDVAAGVWWARGHGADVVNLSLGYEGTSRVLNFILEEAHSFGVVLVASAGNSGELTELHYPANRAEVIAVAAVDADDGKATFSNYGQFVEMSAPGEGIISTYLFGGYAVWSGTSQATPFIAGAAALALEAGASGPDAVRDAIAGAAAPYAPDFPFPGLLGAGRVDMLPIVAPVSGEL